MNKANQSAQLQKIHLCGIYGSGKTTLATKISKKLKIPYYSLTDVKYIIKFSKQRTEKEMRKLVKKIAEKRKWITEECWSDRAEKLFKNADLVILLIPRKEICQYRVLKRFFIRKKQEGDNLKSALKMCKSIREYYRCKKSVSLQAQMKLIKKYKKNVIIIKTNKELNDFLNSLK